MKATDSNLYITLTQQTKNSKFGSKKELKKVNTKAREPSKLFTKRWNFSPHTQYGRSELKSNNVNQQPFCCRAAASEKVGRGKNRAGWKTSCGRWCNNDLASFSFTYDYTQICALVIKMIDSNLRTLTEANCTQASMFSLKLSQFRS